MKIVKKKVSKWMAGNGDTMKPAEFAHDVWARWMKYQFNRRLKFIESHEGGEFEAVGDLYSENDYYRWMVQKGKSYDGLPPEEQESDKKIAAEWARVILEDFREHVDKKTYLWRDGTEVESYFQDYIKHLLEE